MKSYEYKQVRIPLDISAKASASPGVSQEMAVRQAAINAGPQATPRIMTALQAEGAAGWEPDQATDLFSLLHAGQVRWRQSGGLILSWKFTFESVEIRFRRSVTSEIPTSRSQSGLSCARCGSPRGDLDCFCAVCGSAFADGPSHDSGPSTPPAAGRGSEAFRAQMSQADLRWLAEYLDQLYGQAQRPPSDPRVASIGPSVCGVAILSLVEHLRHFGSVQAAGAISEADLLAVAWQAFDRCTDLILEVKTPQNTTVVGRVLVVLTGQQDPGVRALAVLAAGLHGMEPALRAVLEACASDGCKTVRAAACVSLGSMDSVPPEQGAALAARVYEYLEEESPFVLERARNRAKILSIQSGHPEAIDTFLWAAAFPEAVKQILLEVARL